MAEILLFSCRAAGMGNLVNSGGGGLVFRGKQNSDKNAALLAVLPVLRSKTGKIQPGAAPAEQGRRPAHGKCACLFKLSTHPALGF